MFPTCSGAHCAILRENFFTSQNLPVVCLLQWLSYRAWDISCGFFTKLLQLLKQYCLLVMALKFFKLLKNHCLKHVDSVGWELLLLILQGEYKNTPWFQVVIKSKLTGIFLQNWWLQMHKLIQFHVVSHTLNVPPSCYSANIDAII